MADHDDDQADPTDPVRELVADALPAIAEAIDRERAEGRQPRTALALVRAVATARPELLRPAPQHGPPEPAEPAEGDSWLVELDAALDRQMATPPRIGHRRR